METPSLNPTFLQELILRTRGLLAQIGHTSDEEGNFVDDGGAGPHHILSGDMTDDEVMREIEDLEPDQQAELVALFWIGRGDMEPEEWEDALKLAMERNAGPTSVYLLSHPHLAEHWDEALDKLFDGSNLVETGNY